MTGILIVQLGTPDAPTSKALKPYLRQFLSDPRVVETKADTKVYVKPGPEGPRRSSPPQWLWNLILKGIILPFRSRSSAAKYARIWDEKHGSPLMMHTILQTELVQQRFPNNPVRFGMQVGNPSLEKVLFEMIAQGVDRVVVLPMYPQYSATTTASATDTLFKALLKVRRVPAIRVIPPHYEHPAYIDAMAAVIQDDLAQLSWKPEHIVISFHGIPQKYAQRGDPYATHVVRTTRALVKKLGWERSYWTQTYQSLFGRDPWLKPYTDDVLEQLAKKGIKKVAVALPGFTADCLETVDEIGTESREEFEHAGGVHLHKISCLNEHPKWIDAMEQLIREEGHGWIK